MTCPLRKMSVPQIIRQIDEVIRDTHTVYLQQMKKDLGKSAKPCNATCWQEVVPEYPKTQKPFRAVIARACW